MSTGQIIAILAVILLAVAIDLVFMRRLRKRLTENRKDGAAQADETYISGAYSPVLTWLRKRELKLPFDLNKKPGNKAPASNEDKTRPVGETPLINPPNWRNTLLEGLLIAVVILLFFNETLANTNSHLQGGESQVFESLDWTFHRSIVQDHSFPVWNPYIFTGLPYLADPNSHALNPLAGLPVLLFGPQNGLKAGVILSFLVAAWGMWNLAATLGMGRAARLWAALMFALAGQPLARFLQGQYIFVLGFAWIPWIIAGLFRQAQSRRVTHLIGTGFALAFLLLSGGSEHILYILVVIAILAVILPLQIQKTSPFVRFDLDLLTRIGLTLASGLGLAAVQILPQASIWLDLHPVSAPAGLQTLQQLFLSFTSSDIARPDIYAVFPAPAEFYAYIGYLPFLALILLPLAVWKRERKPLVILAAILLLVGLWTSPNPIQTLLPSIFAQFPYVLRILVYGSFAIILLGAYGMDTLWRLLLLARTAKAQPPESSQTGSGFTFTRLMLTALGLFMLAGVVNIYNTNHKLLDPEPSTPSTSHAIQWLREHDPSAHFVLVQPNNVSHDAVISSGFHFIDAWYFYGDIPKYDGMLNQRYVKARPHYVISPVDFPAPEQADVVLVNQVEGYNIYQLLNSLPYAFSVQAQALANGASPELTRLETLPLPTYAAGPNRIEVIADGSPGQILVVLTSNQDGWKLYVDGKEQAVQNVGGYLAVQLQPGISKYVFLYRPTSFIVGLMISLACLGLAAYLLAQDLVKHPWEIRKWIRRERESILAMTARLRTPRASKWWQARGTYRAGVIQLESPLQIDDETSVHIRADTLDAAAPVRAATRRWVWATGDLTSAIAKTVRIEAVFFLLAMGVYAFTRLYALEAFPIYFFGDEAVQTLFAQSLIKQGFTGTDGTFIPMYVEADGLRWTPLLPMYIHALALTLFGKSILVTRATSAIVGMLAPIAVGLALKKVFKVKTWWTAVFFLAITPGWFLHSRTAFETAMTTAFYACFLFTYLLYRTKSPNYLYATLVFGVATFYSYSNAQAIVALAAALLFLSDFRYHWQHKAILIRGLILALILAYPLISFEIHKPAAMGDHLRMVNTYWLQELPLSEKIGMFLQKYSYGLSPSYWFFPNNQDIPRHRMEGFGQIQTFTLPLFLIGLIISLTKIKTPEYRAVLIAALATPAGASLVDIGITRMLVFVIPANILIVLGLEWLIHWIKNQRYAGLANIALFAALAAASFGLLNTALVKGPLWYSDYGLYGMQWGARQLFEEAVPQVLRKDSATRVLVTSSWANGADKFLDFFFNTEDRNRITMDGIERYLFKETPLSRDMLFIMTPSEYQKAVESGKIHVVEVERMIEYPDGTPGFYFARLEYVPNVGAIFAAEKEARNKLVEETLEINGEEILFRYSTIDMGVIPQLFDSDKFTLIRGLEANPFKLEMHFSTPRPIGEVDITLGMTNMNITTHLYEVGKTKPVVYKHTHKVDEGEIAGIKFGTSPTTVSWIQFEFYDATAGETANIHIREIRLVP